MGRLFIHVITCAPLTALQCKYPDSRAFRLPAGNLFAAVGIAFMLALLSQINRSEAVVILVTIAIALANWLWARDRRESQ